MEHFVIRLWVAPAEMAPSTGFHGTAHHVRSGAELAFASEQELLAFLRRTAATPPGGIHASVEIAELERPL